MVGVPGRSKACNTCRKRRIGCSLERPQCAQCIKSNRICSGYQRERIFVIGPKIIVQKLPNKQKNEESARQKRCNHRPPTGPKEGGCLDAHEYAETILPNLHQLIHPYAAFREILLDEFICSWIPDADRAAQQHVSQAERIWITSLPEIVNRSEALEASTLTISTAKLGRLMDDEHLIQESMKLYGQALWKLQKALWKPELMHEDETLAACILLSMYEVMECPASNRSGWVTHSDGCATLLKLRGPDSYTSPLGHQLFISARFTLTMKALSQHSSTYLSEPEWTSLPWRNSTKTIFDRLIDLLMRATQLYEQGYALGDSIKSTSSFAAILDIINQCWDIDNELHRLHLELEANITGPAYWPEFSREENPADDQVLGKVFPIAFHFLSLRIAHTYMLYWTLSIMLWTGLCFLYLTLSATQPDQHAHILPYPLDVHQLPPLDHRTEIMPLVGNICQSLEYCMKKEMQAMGPLAAAFPLQVVIDNLKERDREGGSRELVWAQAMMEKIKTRGFRISGYFD